MATVDIYSKTSVNDSGWIPSPVSKQSPQLNYSISLNDILQLFHFSEIWIYDSSSKSIITMNNLSEYFPDYNPGGGGGGSSDSYSKKEIDAKINDLIDQLKELGEKVDEIDVANETVVTYEQGVEYAAGKIVWLEPGVLYQVPVKYTSNADSGKSVKESMQADIATGKLLPVTDSEVGELSEQIQSLNTDMGSVKTTLGTKVDKEEGMGLSSNDYTDEDKELLYSTSKRLEFNSFIEFPNIGEEQVLYVDTTAFKTYVWDSESQTYQMLDTDEFQFDTIQTVITTD